MCNARYMLAYNVCANLASYNLHKLCGVGPAAAMVCQNRQQQDPEIDIGTHVEMIERRCRRRNGACTYVHTVYVHIR